MQLSVPKAAVPNSLAAMRRAGYSAFTDPKTGESSFVLRLGAGFYPRFHVYIKEEKDNVIFNVHLDQKQPMYGDGAAHGGEYEGPTVEREVRRIASWIRDTLENPYHRGERKH